MVDCLAGSLRASTWLLVCPLVGGHGENLVHTFLKLSSSSGLVHKFDVVIRMQSLVLRAPDITLLSCPACLVLWTY